MITDIVLHTPKKHKRRNKKQHVSAGTQNPTDFSESAAVIVQMFDHIERRDHIKRLGVVRQSFSFAKTHIVQPPFPAEFQRLLRDVHTFGCAKRSQHLEVRAGPASDVEDSRLRSLQLAANPGHETLNNSAAPDIPPMTLFNAKENRIMMLLHLFRKW